MRKIAGLLILWLVFSAHAEGWVGVGVGAPGFFMVEYTQDRARVGLSVDPFTVHEIAFKADWSLAKFHYSLPAPWGTRVQQELRFYVGITGSYFYRPYVLGERGFDYAFGGYAGYGTATRLSKRLRYGLDVGIGLRNPPDGLGYLLMLTNPSPSWGLFIQIGVHLDFAL